MASIRIEPRRRWPANPPPRPWTVCGPTGSPRPKNIAPQMLPRRPVPNSPGQYSGHRLTILDLFVYLVANLSASIIGNVFGFMQLRRRVWRTALPVPIERRFQGPAQPHRGERERMDKFGRPACPRHREPSSVLSGVALRRVVYGGVKRGAQFTKDREHQLAPFRHWRERCPLLHGCRPTRRRPRPARSRAYLTFTAAP